MNISVIIPLFNEQNSLEELTKKIARIIDGMKLQYEILLIDDGSTDNSWNKISKICGINPNVRGIRFLKNFGKSQALSAGFKMCKGDVVITMDAQKRKELCQGCTRRSPQKQTRERSFDQGLWLLGQILNR